MEFNLGFNPGGTGHTRWAVEEPEANVFSKAAISEYEAHMEALLSADDISLPGSTESLDHMCNEALIPKNPTHQDAESYRQAVLRSLPQSAPSPFIAHLFNILAVEVRRAEASKSIMTAAHKAYLSAKDKRRTGAKAQKEVKDVEFSPIAKLGITAGLSFFFALMKHSMRTGEFELCDDILESALELVMAMEAGSLQELTPFARSCVERSIVFLRKLAEDGTNEATRQNALALLIAFCMKQSECRHVLQFIQFAMNTQRLKISQSTLGFVGTSIKQKMDTYVADSSPEGEAEEGKPVPDSLERVRGRIAALQEAIAADDELVELSGQDFSHSVLRRLELFACHILANYERSKQGSSVSINAPDVNEVYATGYRGHNCLAELSSGSNNVVTPAALVSLQELSPECEIYGGSDCTFVLTEGDEFYGWGKGDYGRLGCGDTSDRAVPTKIPELSGKSITQVACSKGSYGHGIALCESGEVYTWGDGDYGKLGHGNTSQCPRPQVVGALQSLNVAFVAAGFKSTACILEDGTLYTWGLGDCGQLGLGSTASADTPRKVDALTSPVKQISIGSYSMTCIMADDNSCMSWGSGEYGRLGTGTTADASLPAPVTFADGATPSIQRLVCGEYHTLFQDSQGELWATGRNCYGQVGVGSTVDVLSPTPVLGPLERVPVHDFDVGAQHSLACTREGEVYVWGWNDHGELGTGNTTNVSLPQLVDLPSRIFQVAAANTHTFFSTRPRKRTTGGAAAVRTSIGRPLPYLVDGHKDTFSQLRGLIEPLVAEDVRSLSATDQKMVSTLLHILTVNLHKLGDNPLPLEQSETKEFYKTLLTKLFKCGVPCIQEASRTALQISFHLLLPSVDERLELLLSLVPNSTAERGSLGDDKFLLDLQLKVLLSDKSLVASFGIINPASEEALLSRVDNLANMPEDTKKKDADAIKDAADKALEELVSMKHRFGLLSQLLPPLRVNTTCDFEEALDAVAKASEGYVPGRAYHDMLFKLQTAMLQWTANFYSYENEKSIFHGGSVPNVLRGHIEALLKGCGSLLERMEAIAEEKLPAALGHLRETSLYSLLISSIPRLLAMPAKPLIALELPVEAFLALANKISVIIAKLPDSMEAEYVEIKWTGKNPKPCVLSPQKLSDETSFIVNSQRLLATFVGHVLAVRAFGLPQEVNAELQPFARAPYLRGGVSHDVVSSDCLPLLKQSFSEISTATAIQDDFIRDLLQMAEGSPGARVVKEFESYSKQNHWFGHDKRVEEVNIAVRWYFVALLKHHALISAAQSYAGTLLGRDADVDVDPTKALEQPPQELLDHWTHLWKDVRPQLVDMCSAALTADADRAKDDGEAPRDRAAVYQGVLTPFLRNCAFLIQYVHSATPDGESILDLGATEASQSQAAPMSTSTDSPSFDLRASWAPSSSLDDEEYVPPAFLRDLDRSLPIKSRPSTSVPVKKRPRIKRSRSFYEGQLGGLIAEAKSEPKTLFNIVEALQRFRWLRRSLHDTPEEDQELRSSLKSFASSSIDLGELLKVLRAHHNTAGGRLDAYRSYLKLNTNQLSLSAQLHLVRSFFGVSISTGGSGHSCMHSIPGCSADMKESLNATFSKVLDTVVVMVKNNISKLEVLGKLHEQLNLEETLRRGKEAAAAAAELERQRAEDEAQRRASGEADAESRSGEDGPSDSGADEAAGELQSDGRERRASTENVLEESLVDSPVEQRQRRASLEVSLTLSVDDDDSGPSAIPTEVVVPVVESSADDVATPSNIDRSSKGEEVEEEVENESIADNVCDIETEEAVEEGTLSEEELEELAAQVDAGKSSALETSFGIASLNVALCALHKKFGVLDVATLVTGGLTRSLRDVLDRTSDASHRELGHPLRERAMRVLSLLLVSSVEKNDRPADANVLSDLICSLHEILRLVQEKPFNNVELASIMHLCRLITADATASSLLTSDEWVDSLFAVIGSATLKNRILAVRALTQFLKTMPTADVMKVSLLVRRAMSLISEVRSQEIEDIAVNLGTAFSIDPKCARHLALSDAEANLVVQNGPGSMQNPAYCVGSRGIRSGTGRFTFRIVLDDRGDEGILLGVAAKPFTDPSYENSPHVWLVRAYNGARYHQGEKGKVAPFTVDDLIEFEVNMTAKTITMYKNGSNLGVAFRDFAAAELFPCIMVYADHPMVRVSVESSIPGSSDDAQEVTDTVVALAGAVPRPDAVAEEVVSMCRELHGASDEWRSAFNDHISASLSPEIFLPDVVSRSDVAAALALVGGIDGGMRPGGVIRYKTHRERGDYTVISIAGHGGEESSMLMVDCIGHQNKSVTTVQVRSSSSIEPVPSAPFNADAADLTPQSLHVLLELGSGRPLTSEAGEITSGSVDEDADPDFEAGLKDCDRQLLQNSALRALAQVSRSEKMRGMISEGFAVGTLRDLLVQMFSRVNSLPPDSVSLLADDYQHIIRFARELACKRPPDCIAREAAREEEARRKAAEKAEESVAPPKKDTDEYGGFPADMVMALVEGLGLARELVLRALKHTRGNPDEAAELIFSGEIANLPEPEPEPEPEPASPSLLEPSSSSADTESKYAAKWNKLMALVPAELGTVDDDCSNLALAAALQIGVLKRTKPVSVSGASDPLGSEEQVNSFADVTVRPSLDPGIGATLCETILQKMKFRDDIMSSVRTLNELIAFLHANDMFVQVLKDWESESPAFDVKLLDSESDRRLVENGLVCVVIAAAMGKATTATLRRVINAACACSSGLSGLLMSYCVRQVRSCAVKQTDADAAFRILRDGFLCDKGLRISLAVKLQLAEALAFFTLATTDWTDSQYRSWAAENLAKLLVDIKRRSRSDVADALGKVTTAVAPEELAAFIAEKEAQLKKEEEERVAQELANRTVEEVEIAEGFGELPGGLTDSLDGSDLEIGPDEDATSAGDADGHADAVEEAQENEGASADITPADPSASVDVSADGSVVASADASVDPAVDASVDSADASVDVSADASVDVSADASVDVSADASADGGVDGADASADGVVDAGSEASVDLGLFGDGSESQRSSSSRSRSGTVERDAPPASVSVSLCNGSTRSPILQLVAMQMIGIRELIWRLPQVLHDQYQHESALVKQGSMLLHSPLLQGLARVAHAVELPQSSDVGATTKGDSDKDVSFSWLASFCTALGCAVSYTRGEAFPREVDLSEEELVPSADSSVELIDKHMDASVFTPVVDAQLGLWVSRYPLDFSKGSEQALTFGYNNYGQLGEGDERMVTPTENSVFAAAHPLDVIPGADCTFLVCEDHVMSIGKGDYGRLGIQNNSTHRSLTRISNLDGVELVQLVTSKGGYGSSFALSRGGEVFSWGDGDFGKLGHGNTNECGQPKVVTALTSVEVAQVACGFSHSAALTKDGKVYTWGQADECALGLAADSNVTSPQLLGSLSMHQMTYIALGSKFTICTNGSTLWHWGRGIAGESPVSSPQVLSNGFPPEGEEQYVKLDCGETYAAALTASGKVLLLGANDSGQVTGRPGSPVYLPYSPPELSDEKIVDISLGTNFTVVVTLSGKVFSWGNNEYGQLGLGHANAAIGVNEVSSLTSLGIKQVRCGSFHSVALPYFTGEPLSPLLKRECGSTLPMPEEHHPEEFPSLADIPLTVLARRVILLRKVSQQIVRALPLFNLHDPANELMVVKHLIPLASKTSLLRRCLVRSASSRELVQVRAQRYPSESKKTIFKQIARHMTSQDPEVYRIMKRWYKVTFVGEGSDDAGGPYNESISQMCDELQAKGKLPILCQTPNTSSKSNTAMNKGSFIINPVPMKPDHGYLYEFFGLLIGLAIRTNHCLNLNIAPITWKQIFGMPVTLADVKAVDENFFDMISYIRDLEQTGVTADTFEEELDFLDDIGVVNDPDDPDAGPMTLTFDNRAEWTRVCIRERICQGAEKAERIRRGVCKVIPLPLMRLFHPEEVDELVCGKSAIDWELLKKHTRYESFSESEDIMKWMWETLEEMSVEEGRLFLRFVWGRTRLPPTLSTSMVIASYDRSPPDNYLPHAATCFFKLQLPRYTSKEVLSQKLKYAISACLSIDTDDYARTGTFGESESSETSSPDDSEDSLFPMEEVD